MGFDTVVDRRPPYPPPYPPYPPHPHPHPHPVEPLPTKNVVLTHKFNKVLYALAVRTTTDAVFDREYKYTLTEMLTDIAKALTTDFQKITELSEAFNTLMEGCPEEFNTLKEIYDYINVDGDPKSALIQLIDSKVDKEEGKGLSSNDFTDLLREKLETDYTKAELDEFISEFRQNKLDTDEAISAVNTRIDNLTDSVATEISELSNNLNDKIDTLSETVAADISNLSDDLNTKIDTLAENVQQDISDLSDSVDTRISEAVGSMTDAVDAVSARVDGIEVRVEDLENRNNFYFSEDGSEIKDGDVWLQLKGEFPPEEG